MDPSSRRGQTSGWLTSTHSVFRSSWSSPDRLSIQWSGANRSTEGTSDLISRSSRCVRYGFTLPRNGQHRGRLSLLCRFVDTNSTTLHLITTLDMSVQNAIGDSFRGATWVALHNGGGVGWGEVMNGGYLESCWAIWIWSFVFKVVSGCFSMAAAKSMRTFDKCYSGMFSMVSADDLGQATATLDKRLNVQWPRKTSWE